MWICLWKSISAHQISIKGDAWPWVAHEKCQSLCYLSYLKGFSESKRSVGKTLQMVTLASFLIRALPKIIITPMTPIDLGPTIQTLCSTSCLTYTSWQLSWSPADSQGNCGSEKLRHFPKISRHQVGQLGFKLILFSLYCVNLLLTSLMCVLRSSVEMKWEMEELET